MKSILYIIIITVVIVVSNIQVFSEENHHSTVTDLQKTIDQYRGTIDGTKRREIWKEVVKQVQYLTLKRDKNLLELLKRNFDLKSPRLSLCGIQCSIQYIAMAAYGQDAIDAIVEIINDKTKFFHPDAAFTVGLILGREGLEDFCSKEVKNLKKDYCIQGYISEINAPGIDKLLKEYDG